METETVKTPEQIAENLWRKRSAENWKDGGLEKPIWIHGCTVGIEHACNSHYELVEALKKAERLLSMAACEVQRPEIQRFLSGGYTEAIENAVFKDSLGITEALKKATS